MIDQFPAGDTRQFTFVCSATPDDNPVMTVYGPNSYSTAVASITSVSSSVFAYYAMYTMPVSADGRYKAIWTALKTVAGSTYPFITEREFIVVDPRRATL